MIIGSEVDIHVVNPYLVEGFDGGASAGSKVFRYVGYISLC